MRKWSYGPTRVISAVAATRRTWRNCSRGHEARSRTRPRHCSSPCPYSLMGKSETTNRSLRICPSRTKALIMVSHLLDTGEGETQLENRHQAATTQTRVAQGRRTTIPKDADEAAQVASTALGASKATTVEGSSSAGQKTQQQHHSDPVHNSTQIQQTRPHSHSQLSKSIQPKPLTLHIPFSSSGTQICGETAWCGTQQAKEGNVAVCVLSAPACSFTCCSFSYFETGRRSARFCSTCQQQVIAAAAATVAAVAQQ